MSADLLKFRNNSVMSQTRPYDVYILAEEVAAIEAKTDMQTVIHLKGGSTLVVHCPVDDVKKALAEHNSSKWELYDPEMDGH